MYDSEITKDVRNFTTTTLKARGNYWNTDGANYTGPVEASNPLPSHNSDASPGGALGKPVAHDFGEPVAASLVPEHFALEQNYPNPFNPSTVIAFSLPEESVLTLIIYDILGRQVRTLVSRVAYNAGIHQLVWNGRDDSGQTLPSGVYVYRLRVTSGHKTFSESRKLVLLQ